MLSQMLSAKLPERLGCTGTDVHPQRLQAQRLCRHRKQGLSFRKFPQRVSWELRAAGEEIMLSDVPEPEDARGAITLGLKFSDAGQYEQALQLFLKALKLPGTGIKQFRDEPPAISDGEKQSALYNVACCYSRLGNTYEGLAAVAGCLESGYTDLAQLRTDPDLENLRKDERFEGLIERLAPNSGGFFGSLLQGFSS